MLLRPSRHAALLLGVALACGGCVTTTALETPSAVVTLPDQPSRLLVQRTDDPTWLRVIQYRATNDSLFGVIEGSAAPGYPLKRLALPYDSIATIQVRRADFVRAALAPTVSAVLGGMVFWILRAP
jgi:hypothetical protein